MPTERTLRISFFLFLALLMALSWLVALLGGRVVSGLSGIWTCLANNKDSIGALSQLLGAIGIAFAVLTFWRTQKLNQATAVFQMMKEARDVKLKINPIPAGGAPPTMQLFVGLNLYSSMFYYRHLSFVDQATWKPFEDDLTEMLAIPGMTDWLAGRANNLELPNVSKYDPRFIEYLRSLPRP